MGREKPRRSAGWGPKFRETGAMLTQARYLSFDLLPRARNGSAVHVVLVHGLYASAGVFRPLRALLERELDASTYSFSYLPGPGVLELSERLRRLVRKVPEPGPIVLMGHSLGGVVVRHYLEQPHASSRVLRSVSMAAPFHGSTKHHLVPGQAGRDLRAGATVVEQLRRATTSRVPHLSLIAEEDQLVVPPACPDYGERESFSRVGHNGILFDERVLSRCVRLVAACMEPQAGESMRDT